MRSLELWNIPLELAVKLSQQRGINIYRCNWMLILVNLSPICEQFCVLNFISSRSWSTHKYLCICVDREKRNEEPYYYVLVESSIWAYLWNIEGKMYINAPSDLQNFTILWFFDWIWNLWITAESNKKYILRHMWFVNYWVKLVYLYFIF